MTVEVRSPIFVYVKRKEGSSKNCARHITLDRGQVVLVVLFSYTSMALRKAPRAGRILLFLHTQPGARQHACGQAWIILVTGRRDWSSLVR